MTHQADDRGPRPLTVTVILVIALLLLGALFAGIRLLLSDIAHENGSVDIVFCRTGDCEAALLGVFRNASDVRCAFYELDLEPVIAALADAEARVLVFDRNAREVNGLAVTPVSSKGLMHHKFCVVDGAIVTTGSMNPTRTAQTRNDENLVVIRSRTLARAYAVEWSILDRRASGRDRKPRVDAPTVDLSGAVVEACFAPAEGCEASLIGAIDGAQHTVYFMTYSFTSDAVGEALVRAQERGASVEGVFERRQLDEWSEDDALRAAGITVRLDGNPGTMHHKAFIIDNVTVVTGSYNPTANAAARNDENMLIVRDAGLAASFLAEYARVRSAASPATG